MFFSVSYIIFSFVFSFLKNSRHIFFPLSYLVSGGVFSRFSRDELLSRAWIRPEALLLSDTDNNPVLTLHFRVEWSSIMKALETDVRGGDTMPKQDNNERQGLLFVSNTCRCLESKEYWQHCLTRVNLSLVVSRCIAPLWPCFIVCVSFQRCSEKDEFQLADTHN